MQIEQHRWWSPRLHRDMELKVYGHWGRPFIVFPCSRGRYFDFEGMGMVSAIAGFIDSGKIKLFAVDSVDGESWYNWGISPAERNARHEAYDGYVADEVIPFVRQHCRSPEERAVAIGCSMGAYHAVNFFLKHPDLFEGTIALSGLYRLDRPEFGLGAADLPAVYFNSPLAYLPGMADPWFLDGYRKSRIIVCVGQGGLGTRGRRGHAGAGTLLPGEIDPGLGGFLGARRQPRLAVVVRADELLPGETVRGRVTRVQIRVQWTHDAARADALDDIALPPPAPGRGRRRCGCTDPPPRRRPPAAPHGRKTVSRSAAGGPFRAGGCLRRCGG